MTGENDNDAVVLVRYVDVRQAEFAVSVLAGRGIDAFINVPYTSSMFPHYALATGGVAVLVRAADFAEARQLLENAGSPTTCYVCGAPVPDDSVMESRSSPESDPPAEFVFLNTERGEFAVCGGCCDKRRFADLSPEEIAYIDEQISALREERDA